MILFAMNAMILAGEDLKHAIWFISLFKFTTFNAKANVLFTVYHCPILIPGIPEKRSYAVYSR